MYSGDALDQRRLRVAPCVAYINDERNPAVVEHRLQCEFSGVTWDGLECRWTYTAEINGANNTFLLNF